MAQNQFCQQNFVVVATVQDFYFPKPMQSLEVYNNGPDDVQVMTNDMSLLNAITIVAFSSRLFTASKPFFKRIGFYSTGTSIVNLVCTRGEK